MNDDEKIRDYAEDVVAARKPKTPEETAALENAEDVAAVLASRAEMAASGAEPRPWRVVALDMGIDPDDLGDDDQEKR